MLVNRRTFVSGAAATVIGGAGSRSTYGNSAADEVRIAVVGVGGQGRVHVSSYLQQKNAKLVAVCDVDQRRRDEAAKRAKCKSEEDLRRLLDDKSIDAVSIATPDHWHTPAALLALEAGKHVYVEKPCSHNLREGKLLVAAAKKYSRVVQHGTQSRTSAFFREAMAAIHGGLIGDVLVAKAWNIQRRANIGKKQPTKVPAGVNYDQWVGPAPHVPFQENRFHYNWHWWHNFGTGDAGNDGVHEMDLARWGLGVDELPTQATAIGGKYFHDDDQQFPDTMTATFHFPGDGKVGNLRQLVFEMKLWSTNYPYNVDSGVEFFGTRGKVFLSKRGKAQVWGERNAKLPSPSKLPIRVSVPDHQANFLEAIRGNQKSNADANTAHLSASLCHLGNATIRLGRSITLEPKSQQSEDRAANQLLGRVYREGHWAAPKI